MGIHQTAIISPEAELEDGVEIGPYVLIDADVKIGKGTKIATGTVIRPYTVIGEYNVIGEHCLIGGEPQDLSFDSSVRTGVMIGDRNTIRESSSIHRASREGENTTVGNDCVFMAVSHLAHDVKVGNNVIIANNTLLAGHVLVEDSVFISGNVAIHQFCRVGRHAMIGGLTKVTMDVLPYSMVDGHPAKYVGLNIVGLRRSKMGAETRKKIKNYYQLFYGAQSLSRGALLISEEDDSFEKNIILEFISNSKRGIVKKSS